MSDLKVRRVDFSPDEWIAGTVGLDNATRGLYITACALIYSNGGPIAVAHLKAACKDHGHAVNRQISTLADLGKLSINDGQIDNKRCAKELQTARKRSLNAQQNGAKSNGRPGKINDLENQAGISGQKLTINHQPSTTKEDDAKASSGERIEQRSDRATRIPADWQPRDEDREWAFAEYGFDRDRADRITAQFIDYWLAEPPAKARKVSWWRTWRNRVRNLPSVATAWAANDPVAVDRAIAASLPLSIASTLRPLYRDRIDPVYGLDTELVGYSLEGAVPASDLMQARQLVGQHLQPVDPRTIKQELARLRVSTKSRAESDDDLAMGFQVIAEECSEYPRDVVVAALRGWARAEVFYPSLAEIRDRLQRAAKKRKAMMAALDRASTKPRGATP